MIRNVLKVTHKKQCDMVELMDAALRDSRNPKPRNNHNHKKKKGERKILETEPNYPKGFGKNGIKTQIIKSYRSQRR